MTASRKRQVNIENLSHEQIERASEKLGIKLREILDRACGEANELLGIYGLMTKIEFVPPFPKDSVKK